MNLFPGHLSVSLPRSREARSSRVGGISGPPKMTGAMNTIDWAVNDIHGASNFSWDENSRLLTWNITGTVIPGSTYIGTLVGTGLQQVEALSQSVSWYATAHTVFLGININIFFSQNVNVYGSNFGPGNGSGSYSLSHPGQSHVPVWTMTLTNAQIGQYVFQL